VGGVQLAWCASWQETAAATDAKLEYQSLEVMPITARMVARAVPTAVVCEALQR